jgi:hypothetical protein
MKRGVQTRLAWQPAHVAVTTGGADDNNLLANGLIHFKPHAANPSARREHFLLRQPRAMTVLMNARRGLAVRNNGPELSWNDQPAAMQAGGRRPVDQPVCDPPLDARLINPG